MNTTNQPVVRLTELPFKRKAIIRSFGETELYVKLLEMGCIPDEEISIELSAHHFLIIDVSCSIPKF